MDDIDFQIVAPGKDDYDELVDVWEASVIATHDFLTPEDIARMKPQVHDVYLNAVDLNCVKNSRGQIVGFIGTHEDRIEMLFVDPEHRGKSVGKFLTRYATDQLGMTKVDVNEQNEQAVGFYEHLGFEVIGRSPLDGQGQPFPLLHLKLRGK